MKIKTTTEKPKAENFICFDPSKVYFACDDRYFFIYTAHDQKWKCAVSGIEVVTPLPRPGEKLFLDLSGTGIPVKQGRYGRGPTIDDVLDFYNSGHWGQWSKED